MKDSKLLEILNTFSTKEKKDLEAFLNFSIPRTRYEVAATDVLRLWTVLRTMEKNFRQESMDTEKIYPLLFPKKAFVKGRLEKAMSALLREVEKYVSFTFYTEGVSRSRVLGGEEVSRSGREGGNFSRSWAMLDFLSERQLQNRFETAVERLKTETKQPITKDILQYLDCYLSEYVDNRYQEHYNTKQGDVNLLATLESLDTFYAVARLEHLLTLAAQKRHIGVDVKQEFDVLNDLENIIAKKNLGNVPLIQVYLQALHILLGQGDWAVFSQILIETHDNLTFEQRQSLYAIQRNHCAALYNTGQKEYLPVLADLFAVHLEAGYLYYKNSLIPSTLLNIIMVGTKVKRFDWVKTVIEKYSDKIISADDTNEITRTHWALYHFAIGDYSTTLNCLQSTYKFKDIYYELSQRRLEIKVFYEQKEDDICAARNEAFKNYLFNWSKKKKANSLPPHVFELNNNFVNMITQLLNTAKGDAERIELLKHKLENSRIYGDSEWLLEKLRVK